ncbi:MAG: Inner membrane protein YbjJ [Candidatus Erwinia impunctatus]|nr:Inner membrane protein YbjJ [Culicoides impunctatus]
MLVIIIAIALSLPALLPFGNQEESDDTAPRGKARPNLRLVLMAVMAMVCFMAEGAAIDWSGIFITQERGLSVENAGWGFAVFALAMSLMRFLGDRVVRLLGRTKVLVCGGLTGCAGYLIAVFFPGWIMPLCGFALVGLGTANIVPVLITLAGQEKVMPVNMSVAMVATLGYLGILGGLRSLAGSVRLPV